MKVIKFSPNKKQLKIGDNDRDSKWYHVTDAVSTEGIQADDEVTFTSDVRGSQSYLTFLSKGQTEAPTVTTPAVTAPVERPPVEQTTPKVETKTAPKTKNTAPQSEADMWLAKDLRIQRQSIGKMVAETLKSVEGVTQTNVIPLIHELYVAYTTEVNG